MNVVEDLALYHKNQVPLVVALGNFDGVHRGHQEIFRATVKKAHAVSGHAGIMTFKEHPQQVLHRLGKPVILTPLNQRLALFSELGIQTVFLLHFTEAFSRMQPQEFVKEILVGRLGVNGVCMGFNARFGINRSGDVGTMKEYSVQFGFDFLQVGPVKVDEMIVSSSEIRESIWRGDLVKVQKCLGREFSLYGEVVAGEELGRKLGFPTANLKIQSEVMPPRGVYLVHVNRIKDMITRGTEGSYRHSKEVVEANLVGVLNYGVRPTVNSSQVGEQAEVHLINWKGNLYGETLEIRFIKKIREEKRFADTQELKTQIGLDIQNAQELIKNKSFNN